MKKIIAWLLACLLLCTAVLLSACKPDDSNDPSDPSTTSTDSTSSTEQTPKDTFLTTCTSFGTAFRQAVQASGLPLTEQNFTGSTTQTHNLHVGITAMGVTVATDVSANVQTNGTDSQFDCTLSALGEQLAVQGTVVGGQPYLTIPAWDSKAIRLPVESDDLTSALQTAELMQAANDLIDTLNRLATNLLNDSTVTATEQGANSTLYSMTLSTEQLQGAAIQLMDALKENALYVLIRDAIEQDTDDKPDDSSADEPTAKPTLVFELLLTDAGTDHQTSRLTVSAKDGEQTPMVLTLTERATGGEQATHTVGAELKVQGEETTVACTLQAELSDRKLSAAANLKIDEVSLLTLSCTLQPDAEEPTALAFEVTTTLDLTGISEEMAGASMTLPITLRGTWKPEANGGHTIQLSGTAEAAGMLSVQMEYQAEITPKEVTIQAPAASVPLEDVDTDALLQKLSEQCPTLSALITQIIGSLQPSEVLSYTSADAALSAMIDEGLFNLAVDADISMADGKLHVRYLDNDLLALPYTQNADGTISCGGATLTEEMSAWSYTGEDGTMLLFVPAVGDESGYAILCLPYLQDETGFTLFLPDGSTLPIDIAFHTDGSLQVGAHVLLPDTDSNL